MAWSKEVTAAVIGGGALIVAALIGITPSMRERPDGETPPAPIDKPVNTPPRPESDPPKADPPPIQPAPKVIFATFEKREYVDADYLEEGMKACRKGFGVGGMNVRENKVLCRRVIAESELQHVESLVDAGTRRKGMHTCPAGMYVRGYHDEKNLLLCSGDTRRRLNPESEGEDGSAASPATQAFGMHVCGTNSSTRVLTGINAGENRFLCNEATP